MATPPPPEGRRLYRFGAFSLSPSERRLLRGTVEVPLIPRYFDLLVLLVERRQEAVHRREIMGTVWSDVVVSDSALTQAIRTIRRALDDDPREPRYIRTVSRHGYRFVGPEEEVAPAAPAGVGTGRRAAGGGRARRPLEYGRRRRRAARRGRGAPPGGHGRGAGAARRTAGTRACARVPARRALGRPRRDRGAGVRRAGRRADARDSCSGCACAGPAGSPASAG